MKSSFRVITFLLLILLGSCSVGITVAPTDVSTETVTQQATETKSPTSTPLEGILGVEIAEQDFPLEFDPIANINPGMYLLFNAKNGDAQEIWAESLDGEAFRLLSCPHCPIEFSYVTSGSNPMVIYVSTASDDLEYKDSGKLIVDLFNQSASLYTCKPISATAFCRGGSASENNDLMLYLFEKNNNGTRTNQYFVWHSLNGAWTSMKVPSLSETDSLFMVRNSNGVAINWRDNSCSHLPVLSFIPYATGANEDWSALPCSFERPNSVLLGWSPDGSKVAFTWTISQEDSDQAFEILDGVVVCPSDALGSGDSSECTEVISNLSSRDIFSSPDIDISWLDEERFLWIRWANVADKSVKLGTLDLEGRNSTLYQGPYIVVKFVSPDSEWLLYQLPDTPHSVGVINLRTGQNQYISSSADMTFMDWLVIP